MARLIGGRRVGNPFSLIGCVVFTGNRNRCGPSIVSSTLLNFRKLSVFQLKQALQSLYLILKVINAGIEFAVLPAGTFKLFHGHSGAGICPTCKLTISTSGAALSFVPAAFIIGNQKLEFVTTGRCFVGRTGLGLLSNCGIKGALGLLKILILLSNNTNRLSTSAATDLLCRRNTQHLTTLQPVDIVVNKCVRVQILKGQHNLLHGQPVVRTNSRRNSPQCVRRTCWPKRARLITGASGLLYSGLATSRFGIAHRRCWSGLGRRCG